VGIVSGSYPALFLSSFHPVAVLKSRFTSKRGMQTTRSVFVVIQFSIAIALIICTFMIYKQHNYLIKKELGFEKEHILYLTINNSLKQNYDSFKDKLLKNPDITSVTVASTVPASIGNCNPIDWEGNDTDEMVPIQFAVTDHDYVSTFQMNIVEGRDFSKDIATDVNNFILNRTAIEYLKLDDPIGTLVGFMGAKGEIIGVVDDFHNLPLHAEIRPVILTINPDNYSYFLKYVFVKVRGANLNDTIGYIKETSKQFAPEYPCDYNFMDEQINQIYASVQQNGNLINAFAVLAIFISCLGLLGLASFVSEQRTKEIGVRKVLGASVSGLLVLISKDFVKYVIIATLIACPIAYYACVKFLENFAYKTSITIDVFIVSGILALCISILSVSLQALKAAIANPVDSLRYE
jgi:putative ABC transport system permease protein